jgi:hypothetical protein
MLTEQTYATIIRSHLHIPGPAQSITRSLPLLSSQTQLTMFFDPSIRK